MSSEKEQRKISRMSTNRVPKKVRGGGITQIFKNNHIRVVKKTMRFLKMESLPNVFTKGDYRILNSCKEICSETHPSRNKA